MAIDWTEFDDAFADLTRSQLEQIARDYPDQPAYQFLVHCDADYGRVVHCIFFRPQGDAVGVQFPKYTQHPPRDPDGLNYSYANWEDIEIEPDPNDPRVTRWESWTENCGLKEFGDDHNEHRNEFLRRACRGVLELERDGAFALIKQEPSFVLLVTDHDEGIYDSWTRLIEARIEVAPPWTSASWPIAGRHPDIAEAIFVLAVEYREHGRQREAAHLLREAIARLPELQGSNSFAMDGTDVALPIAENSAWARAYLALLAEHRYDDEKQEIAIEQALKFDPNLADAYFARANQWAGAPFTNERIDHGVADLDRAILLDPTHAEWFGLRAELRARPYYPFYEQALRDYTTAHELDPFNVNWLMRRGELHVQLGEHEAAIADFTRVFELRGSTVSWLVRDALRGRAESLQATGQFSAALDQWNQLLDFERHSKYHQGRAACLRALGDEEAARAADNAAEEAKSREF